MVSLQPAVKQGSPGVFLSCPAFPPWLTQACIPLSWTPLPFSLEDSHMLKTLRHPLPAGSHPGSFAPPLRQSSIISFSLRQRSHSSRWLARPQGPALPPAVLALATPSLSPLSCLCILGALLSASIQHAVKGWPPGEAAPGSPWYSAPFLPLFFQECSLFYSKRFCLPCVQENIDAFPQEIQQDLEKRKVPSKRPASQPSSQT